MSYIYKQSQLRLLLIFVLGKFSLHLTNKVVETVGNMYNYMKAVTSVS